MVVTFLKIFNRLFVRCLWKVKSTSRHMQIKICIHYIVLVKVNQDKSKYWLGFDTGRTNICVAIK